MEFKSLIVHMDDSAQSERRAVAAMRMAQRFGSRLAGVYLVPTAELTPSVAAMLPASSVARRLAESGEAQHRAESLFRSTAAALAVTDIAFRAPAGDPMDAAIAHARSADLAIIGQPDEGSDTAAFTRRLAEHVLLESGAPVLIVPYAGRPGEPGTNVLIAWDAGREAARTIHDALPILVRAAQVTVVSVAHDPAHADALAQAQARLAAYLSAHGINAHFLQVDAHDRETGERLLSEVDDRGADLIVMGGYGHSRSRELVLGGATRTLLHAMTVPVLMSH